MIKKSIGATLVVGIMITSVINADDKSFAYDVIKNCQEYIDEKSKINSPIVHGVISGMGVAYTNTIRNNNIDNEFAPLTPGEYGKQMCKFTLALRKSENEKTGGKYDVTKFYRDLIDMGYYMSLPPTSDTNTTN